MKKQIIELIENISTDDVLNKLSVELTINYIDLIKPRYVQKIPFDLKHINDHINSVNKIRSFNLTLTDKFNYKNCEFSNKYWYRCNYIFHGENKIMIDFNFIAPYLSLDQLPKKIKYNNDFDKIKLIGKTYIDSSKQIYKTINN